MHQRLISILTAVLLGNLLLVSNPATSLPPEANLFTDTFQGSEAFVIRRGRTANVQPHIRSISPRPVVGSTKGQWLTIYGSGFEEGFTVQLRTEGVDAHIEDRQRLRYRDDHEVRVRATLGAEAAEWAVQVLSEDGRASNVHSFNVVAPKPHIEVMRPVEHTAGGRGFTLTVYGSTLAPSSVIRWNGEVCPTTPIKSSESPNALTVGLKAEIPATAVTEIGRNEVRVYTPPPGGGLSPPKGVFVNPRPFYRTPWFFIICIVGLIIVGIGLHRWRLKLLRQRELQQKVEERTRALREQKNKTEEQAERLEALDRARSRLFRDLSHELRTPLTMISTPLRDVLSGTDGDLPDPVRESIDVALCNAERLEELMDRVLELSRLETGRLSLEPRPGDLVEFARDVVRSFVPMAERNDLTLRFRADQEELPTAFDPEKLHTVLGNLVENALKFTPEGGKVLIRVERTSDETASLHVSDTGPGISDDEIPRLFDRLHQGEASRRHRSDGSGLGLALVKELTELHGGTVDVESEPGMGTTFTVILPLREPEEGMEPSGEESRDERTQSDGPPVERRDGDQQNAPRPEWEVSTDEEQASSTESLSTLLIVEDNADVRTYLRQRLSGDYLVETAEGGAEAFETARSTPPDLIISDVMMHEMDGVELCRRIKADDDLRDVPVILLTAKAGEEAQVEGLDAGADAYVEKPFSMEALRARVRALLERRKVLRDQYSEEIVMQPSEVSITSEEQALYEEARAVVEEHIGDRAFDVGLFVSEMGSSIQSKSQLRRKIKAATGLTPSTFIRQMRLQRAAQLLEQDEDLRVYEVADAVGYGDADYFSRRFREHFGVPPSQYLSDEE